MLMIDKVSAGPGAPHLRGALVSCGIALFIICIGRTWAVNLEKKTIHLTAPQDFFIKNQGLAFQRAAAHTPDILLLYGSSELTDPVPNRAPQYFARAPTGFEVCPIGKPGCTSLNMVQKVAALGDDLDGKKLAISISPSFFFRSDVNPPSYAGNFSLQAASGLIFGAALDSDLKREVAIRMRQFPDTLSKSALLNLATQCVVSARAIDQVVFDVIEPLGKLQNLIFDFQDHFEALVYILSGGKKIPRRELRGLFKPGAVDLEAGGKHKGAGFIGHRGEEEFRSRITSAAEWRDLELLFRTIRQIGAHPLVLSLPLDGPFYDAAGVSRIARQVYYDRLRTLAGRYGIALTDFEDHDEDASFQNAHTEHPTENGWTYYNRVLDQFFHSGDQSNRGNAWPR